jgi:hypothetical protein
MVIGATLRIESGFGLGVGIDHLPAHDVFMTLALPAVLV